MKVLIALLTIFVLSHAAPQSRVGLKPKLDGRIVGGQPVDIINFPHQVTLLFFGSHICGGSIIATNFVITAAHCTDGLSPLFISFRAGSSFWASGGVTVQAAQIIQHPQYNPTTVDFDISVVQLNANFGFGLGISAISLPFPGQEWQAGILSTVSGWGHLIEGGNVLPSQLQAVTVPIVSIDLCRASYGFNSITENMLCAGVPQGGLDACQGDSGGPLTIGQELAGIVSWGYGCARPNFPGVYSNVAMLRGFIKLVTGL